MHRQRQRAHPFLSGYFLTSVASIIVAILAAQYISEKSKTFKELPVDTLILDSAFYATGQQSDWHKIDVHQFSIETPKFFHYTKKRGMDSKVGMFTSKTDTILFDYGAYSYGLEKEMNDPMFESQALTINGVVFTIVKSKSKSGTLGIYTSDLRDGNRLNMMCYRCDSTELVLKMFQTIKFRK